MGSKIIDELRDGFNAAQGSARLIAFLSPTCGPCRYGQGVVRALFEEFPDHNLAGLIIWVPMLPGDNVATAQSEQEAITDPRFRFWFDEDKAAANAWSSFIGYPATTWDVYAGYDESAAWADEAPPTPSIWMHQLNETPATRLADRLDVARLAREWLDLVGGDSVSGSDLERALDKRGRGVSQRADSAVPRC